MKKLIAGLIIASGVFTYQMIEAQTRFDFPQFALFITMGGILGSIVLWQYNRWIGLLAGLCSFGFFKTYLMQQGPVSEIFRAGLIMAAIFLIYGGIRRFNIGQDVFKILLIPACLNIILIFVQAFDHSILPFMPVDGISGFIGSTGRTACYLAMTTPIFIRCFKIGLIPLAATLLICRSSTAIIAFVVILLLWLKFDSVLSRKLVNVIMVITLLSGMTYAGLTQIRKHSDAHQRLCMWVGTTDGIMHNPILGWGVGTFYPTMKRIPMEETYFLGIPFNQESKGTDSKLDIMNHPHNEILFGWWNLGVLFPILVMGYLIDFVRRFNKEYLTPFLICVGGFVCSMGYFLTPPSLFLLLLGMGIYDNRR